ncbi:MAG: hypothetical protein HY059_22620 [Proteobacteria bacterium]|nr:hypothetical protein [Pseudomonadota bacterium]
MRRAALFAALGFLGCAGTPKTVKVARFAPQTPHERTLAESLETVYIVVEEPAAPTARFGGFLGHFDQRTQEIKSRRLPAEDLARAVAVRLRADGAVGAVYRVRQADEPDPYADILRPSSTLHLRAGPARVSSSKRVDEPEKWDKGKLVSPEKSTWSLDADWRVEGRFSAKNGVRFDYALNVGESGAVKVKKKADLPDIDEWLREHAAALIEEAAGRIASRFELPRTTYELPVASAAAEGRAAWFAPPLAVLPFSDETTSVDGPVAVRKLLWSELEAGGYEVLPLDAVDEALRPKGFTQGGQLKAAKRSDLAAWTSSKRLLFGNVEYYHLLPASLVAGGIELWDAGSAKTVFLSSATAAMEKSLPGAFDTVRRTSGLGWTATMLLPTAETVRFVRRALRGLPLRASPVEAGEVDRPRRKRSR